MWRPEQAMGNFATSEMAKASPTAAAYRAYIVPELSKRPWIPQNPDRERSITAWNNKMRGLRSGQPMNMQSSIFYRIRFIADADLEVVSPHFGGVVAQWDLIGAVLNLAIIDSPFADMEYDRLLHIRVAGIARERFTESARSINFFVATID